MLHLRFICYPVEAMAHLLYDGKVWNEYVAWLELAPYVDREDEKSLRHSQLISVELDGISRAGNEQKQCSVTDDGVLHFEVLGHDVQAGSDGLNLVRQELDC